MKNEKYVRKRYLINPAFQLRFMLYIAIAVSLGLLVLYVSNFYYFDHLIADGQDIGLDQSHPYFEFIQDQRDLLTQIYIVVSLIVFTALMLFGLFLSHRIVGPIYRIEKYLQEVAAGEEHLRPVTLRDGDFFPEIAGIVNNTIKHFEDEHGVVLKEPVKRPDVPKE